MTELPKILIVSRLVWDDTSVSNTLGNLFKNYDPDKIARIYIESKPPKTACCKRFFQISEFSLIKKLYNPSIKTGHTIITTGNISGINNPAPANIEKSEDSIFKYVRSHRSIMYTWAREILWMFNGWKTKELKKFILDFNPDVVWVDGSPLILMNRLNNYVLDIANKPSVTFLMDDVYHDFEKVGFLNRCYKKILKRLVLKTVTRCNHVFVASPKMKNEYDAIFNVNSTFITKSLDAELFKTDVTTINNPVRLIYLGNVLIGRLNTLCLIAKAMKEINTNQVRITLDIYTGDYISEANRELLNVPGVTCNKPVSYDEVPRLISQSDVQVFVESLNSYKNNAARLSFSTKILDYISSGKCILAIGAKDIAPIEYLREEDAALVASSENEIMPCLQLLLNPSVIKDYAAKAIECGRHNHSRDKMDKQIFDKLIEVSEYESKAIPVRK